MKKFILAASVLMGILFFGKAQAQLNISINIGSQPSWGPTGYNHVDYYYLPDINSYYDVSSAQYIYLQGNRWRHAKRLPNRYRNYDIYNAYKVVVNRPTPYNNYQMDQSKYGHYKGMHSQPILRDYRKTHAYSNNNGNHYNNNNKHVVKTKTVRSNNGNRKVSTRTTEARKSSVIRKTNSRGSRR